MAVSLISSSTLVQTPYIKVKIGDYDFGCYNEEAVGSRKFPNYIKSLTINKINGQVNNYSLTINYTITEQDDPNFFEKVFASVSISRKIEFTYGDLSAADFIYRNEKAIITNVTSNFSIDNSLISYNVSAISNSSLCSTGAYPFPAPSKPVKPSDIILSVLQNPQYGLQNLFTGMRNIDLVKKYLIPGTDLEVQLQTKTNLSPLSYLQYLVDNMTPQNSGGIKKSNFYIMTFIDDTTDIFQGTYFKIVEVDKNLTHPDAYDLYIGYPTANCVKDFKVENNENYSIYFNYQDELHPEQYVKRVNALGEMEDVYAPIISSGNDYYKTTEADKSWWTKVSQYPITASVDLKGLLRPAILMNYVRLYVLFFGKLHIHSGVYIITKQVDTINESGYMTTLNMVKVSNDVSLENRL